MPITLQLNRPNRAILVAEANDDGARKELRMESLVDEFRQLEVSYRSVIEG